MTSLFGHADSGLAIHMDEVSCDGTESNVALCEGGTMHTWDTHDCTHDEDVGVQCYIGHETQGNWKH